MYFTVYKIINKINNKYYIGKHQTIDLNDGYMGSGKLLKRAIKKYGVENFTKEILFVFDNEQNMNDKEKELVIISEETYNLCEGGKGGFGEFTGSQPLEGGGPFGTVCGQLVAVQVEEEFYHDQGGTPVGGHEGA